MKTEMIGLALLLSLYAGLTDSWLSYLRPRDWEILIMEALLHVPENEEKTRTFRITILDDLPSPPAAFSACTNGCPKKEVGESK